MHLDRDSLELLMMDEQAGALSAEASQLLEIYLEQNPDAARQAGEFRQTMDLARMAYAAQPKPVLPEPAFAMTSAAEPRHPSRFGLPALAAMAACLAIGFLIGKMWMVQPPVIQEAVREPVAAMAAITVQPVLTSQNPGSFWSVKNWQMRTNETSRRGGYSVEWESPVKKPRIKANS
jgi:anti-sigma factor RsiW